MSDLSRLTARLSSAYGMEEVGKMTDSSSWRAYECIVMRALHNKKVDSNLAGITPRVDSTPSSGTM